MTPAAHQSARRVARPGSVPYKSRAGSSLIYFVQTVRAERNWGPAGRLRRVGLLSLHENPFSPTPPPLPRRHRREPRAVSRTFLSVFQQLPWWRARATTATSPRRRFRLQLRKCFTGRPCLLSLSPFVSLFPLLLFYSPSPIVTREQRPLVPYNITSPAPPARALLFFALLL